MIIFVFLKPMHTLFLLRHAKSSWDNAILDDIDRPLNKRGKGDAPLMGRFLTEKGDIPELIISSTAKRALSTAKRVANEIGYKSSKIKKNEKLYMADTEDFRNVIEEIDDNIRKLMLVSHNNGITDFANFISNSDIGNIPTCGIVKIEFTLTRWKDITHTKGRLIYFEFPKNILRHS